MIVGFKEGQLMDDHGAVNDELRRIKTRTIETGDALAELRGDCESLAWG